MPSSQKIKVAIIDDHFAIRDGYKALLYSFDFVNHVDTFSNSAEYFDQTKLRKYELLITDIELKGENGLDLCKRLKATNRKLKILVLSSYHSEEYIMNAYQNEADGYLFKDSDAREVRTAVEQIMFEDKRYFGEEAMQVIIKREESRRKSEEKIKTILTSREVEIINYILNGKSNKEIGVILSVAETTISSHKQNIMKKLDAHKTIDLFRFANEHGLISQRKDKDL